MLPLIASCGDAGGGAEGVFLDGELSEWSDAAIVVQDEADAPGAAIDIRFLQALDEGAWLYLSLDVGREVNAQSMPGTLHLLVDGDGDEATGVTLHEMRGVDLTIGLSHKRDPKEPGYGAGFSMRAARGGGELVRVSSYALGVTVAPTWSASRFEMRLSRLGAASVIPLGDTVRLKVVYVEGGEVADETAVGSYGFRTASAPASEPVAPWSPKARGSLRIAAWNVAGESFTMNAEGFARVLAGIEPDIVLLDEVTRGITREDVEAFLALEPLQRLGEWRFILGQGGGRQRTVVAARNRDLRPAESMRRVDYREEELLALTDRLPGGYGRLLEAELERGLSATGAWVDVGGTEALFVPVDLQSAGWAGSPQDLLRIVQARTIRAAILAERGDAPLPVVIGGDLNLVGSRDPLLRLVEGLDADGSDLLPVEPPRIGERTFSTWRYAEGLFGPGRLDFLLVPDAAVEVTHAFVFGTEDLDETASQRLGLEAGLSAGLSDHLVVVADLRFR